MNPDRRPAPFGGRPLISRDACLVWLVASAVLVASLVPLGSAGSGVPGADKLLHAVGYGLLCAAVLRWRRPGALGGALAAIAAVATYGAGVELLQGAVPTRSPSLLDALANALGATLVAAVWWLRR